MTDTIDNDLIRKNEELQTRLDAAEEALRAIQSGEVDALVIYGEDGDHVYTLEGADYTYRVMVENIREGVATLLGDGTILYGNQRLAEMLAVPLETLLGSDLICFIPEADQPVYHGLLQKGIEGSSKAEITLSRKNGTNLPALLSFSSVENKGRQVLCMVATDLTEQKRSEEILAAEKMARSILEQASEAIVVCDKTGTIIRASQSVHEITRGTPLFQPFEKVFPLALNRVEDGGEVFSIEAVLAGKSYRGIEAILELERAAPLEHLLEFDLLLSAAPLRNERDEILGCILSLTDITQRKEGERRLAVEKEWFRTTLASIGDGVITTDPRGIVTFLNPIAEQLTGWTSQEAIGMPSAHIFPIVNELSHSPIENPVGKVLLDGQVLGLTNQTVLIARDGRAIPVEDSAAPIRDADGRILGVIMVFHDVTEKRRADLALRQSRDRLLMTTEAVEIGLWDWDLISNSVIWDERCKAIFGLGPEAWISYPGFLQAVHPEDRERVDESISSALANHTGFEAEYRTEWPDGSIHWIFLKGQSISNEDGEAVQMLGIVMDITSRKAIEEEIQVSQARLEMQRHLITQREQERQQIARDLHDGPLQALLAITFALREMRMDNYLPEIAQKLEAIQGSVQEQINELRTFASDLRPPILMKFGLNRAIQMHMETYQEKNPGIQLQFEETSLQHALPEEVSIALFRIYQEALNNISKHAQATQAIIRLSNEQRQITLEIQDNGNGFVVPKDWLQLARQGNLGLVGIRERAEAVHGKVRIESTPGKGTTLFVWIPLNRSKETGLNE